MPQELDPPVPVVLRDKTGLVTAIGPADVAELEQWAPTVHQDPSDSNAFVVTWMGGPCEQDVALYLASQDVGRVGDYVLDLAASQKGDCPAIGYPRGVRVETSSPIPVTSIEVRGST